MYTVKKSFCFQIHSFHFTLALISSFESLASQFFAPLSPQFVAPVFCDMSVPQSDAAVAAAAAATPSQVRLDEFTEENVEQWFESHRWQFHSNKVTRSAAVSYTHLTLPTNREV